MHILSLHPHPTNAARQQQGYTLIELLLYVAIVGALLTGVTFFYSTVASARVKNQTISEVNSQGVAAMDYLTQTVRNATAITVPAVGASGASLTLTVPTAGLSPTVFSLTGTTPIALQVKEGAAAALPLTNDDVQISGLTFKNLSRASTPGVVQISFVIGRVNPSNINEFDYQKTFTSTAEVAW
jgi:prepilin-type N-terminal cleavage/methylation domain-containing protein